MFENLGKMAGQLGGAEALKAYLSGLSFPLDKAQIVRMVASKGVPDSLMGLLNKLPENKVFQNEDQVVKEAQETH
jgi:hypothetical protein